MRPVVITTTVLSNDRDGVAQAQTTAGAGSFTLNGALVSGGVGTAPYPQPVNLYSTGNISAVTFTITGTDADGVTISESRVGPNNNSVATAAAFKTVTSVAVGAAVGTNTEVGFLAANGSTTRSVPVNWRQTPFNMTVAADLIASTGTFGVQYTVDDPQGSYSASFSASASWRDCLNLDKDSNTADGEDNIITPVRAVRGVSTVGTATQVIKYTFMQGT